jgi:4a-hydroxytetrahydrobiopterin dehydratase
MTDSLTPDQFDASDGVADWRVTCDGACAFFRSPSFAASAAFVAVIAAIEAMGAPGTGADIRHDGVTVRLLTQADDWWGPSARDIALARAISGIAREHGLEPDPTGIQSLLIVPGAPDTAAIVPFWRAVLGYESRRDSPDLDLVDARDRDPAFWFEGMNRPRGDGGGAIHLAVWLPYELAEARVAAALAAGGHLVRDVAPMWWTLADPAGNEVDVATTRGRS